MVFIGELEVQSCRAPCDWIPPTIHHFCIRFESPGLSSCKELPSPPHGPSDFAHHQVALGPASAPPPPSEISHSLPTKVPLVKAMVFPVVMYGCESWTVKKAEHQKIDAFELWCWRRLLRVPGTVRRSNQSILKEISPGCSLEGLMLKLKLHYFGHLCEELTHWKRP